MKKILIVHETLNGGGAEKVLINILNSIDYSKYSVDFALLHHEGVYLEQINKNVNIIKLFPISSFNNKIFNRIYHKVKNICIKHFSEKIYNKKLKNNYDVEIAFLEGPVTYFLSKSSNLNKIAWVHTDLERLRRLEYKVEEECYNKFNKIICVSNEGKNIFNKIYPKYAYKVEVIYNLIDDNEIRALSRYKADKYNFNKSTVIAVGRLNEVKRFDLLIRAHKLLLDDGIDHNLIILGEGDLKKDLMELAKKLQVQQSVKFLGFIKNPYPYIYKSDLFVMSSDFEGLPLVICEALVLEKAIVSTKCTGPTELLGNGEYGVLVECSNVIELKNSIKNILINKKIKKYYENKSKERSVIFKRNEIMNRIYEIIES